MAFKDFIRILWYDIVNVNILSNGEVCIEFLKNANQQERIVDVCRISQDGLKITVYKPDGKHSPSLTDRSLSVSKQKVYSYENLPRQYWKKYLYAARFVKLVRAKTPKITYYSERAKFMLMENAPDADFEGSFMLGGKITKHGDLTTVIDTDGIVYNIHSEEEAMSFKPKIQSMWEHFNQCHQYCRDLEATLQALEDLKGFSCFPIIVGRYVLYFYKSIFIFLILGKIIRVYNLDKCLENCQVSIPNT
ncbi:serine/threonine-protein kinase PLK4-like [Centruroides sculpturatus]|uniref:serine/threonine-protein kinase PLK4-like n=1 Tax=Centruroides sculpturatus TaxID=218467 RepID=UPI000C6DD18F|nr:serine/threonine-protein kinase PLK4-like [Centruroides sculpturatus]